MTDVVGYAAASAVLATFLMRSMVPLRLVAILSNILFLSFGYLAQIHPVLVLHAALLPINIVRLAAQETAAFRTVQSRIDTLHRPPPGYVRSHFLSWD